MSDSIDFVIAFNPNYNMKGKKKIDPYGDSPFHKIIEMYGQKNSTYNSVKDLIRYWCECDGFEYEEMDDTKYLEMTNHERAEKVKAIQDQIPKNWKWAEIYHPDGTVSRISDIILGMADVDLTGSKEDGYNNSLENYDAENGYMVLIHKG